MVDEHERDIRGFSSKINFFLINLSSHQPTQRRDQVRDNGDCKSEESRVLVHDFP